MYSLLALRITDFILCTNVATITMLWEEIRTFLIWRPPFDDLKVNLHSIRFFVRFRPFFYVFAFSWKSMRFFIRIFISPYPH